MRATHIPRAIAVLLHTAAVMSQSIYPSNDTTDLLPAAQSPRYLLNGTEIPDSPPIRLAPLGPYAQQSHHDFVSTDVSGRLINIDASNANNNFPIPYFFYISCDPEDYATGNLRADQVFTIAIQNSDVNLIILYTKTSDHCMATGLETAPEIWGVYTTTDTMVARMVAAMDLTPNTAGIVTLLPDLNSYTNATNGPGGLNGYSWSGRSPTTAVAMIILYSITGVITALFLTIIVTGAIRAHRHPERYGPRNIIGRGRQSRAKGIARAMLDTIPIVKFGDRNDQSGAGGATPAGTVAKPASVAGTQDGDIEMTAGSRDGQQNTGMTEASTNKAVDDIAGTQTTAVTEILPTPIDETTPSHPPTSGAAISADPDSTTSPETAASTAAIASSTSPTGAAAAAALSSTTDPSSEDQNPSCSICTEDFHLGASMRVLPCNHKFHPECVDPWLLNVSGTCPLCRIDLRPPEAESTAGEEGSGSGSVSAEVHRLGSLSQDSYQPQAQHLHPYRMSRATAGFRAGEDLLMAGSLRSGRSRRMSSGAAGVSSTTAAAGNIQEAASSSSSSSAFANLRRALGGTREERVAALRRFRRENNGAVVESSPSNSAQDGTTGVEDERRGGSGLATRLRERLRVRTERREVVGTSGGATTTTTTTASNSAPPSRGADEGPTLGQIRSREYVGGREL